MLSKLVLASLALTTTLAADVDIAWEMDMAQTATAERGDTLRFSWSGTRPIGWVATQAEFNDCTLTDAYGMTQGGSPQLISVPADTPDGTVLYFINTRGDHCSSKGIKVAVTVNGGTGGDAGWCVAIACRTTHNEGSPTKDYECCSLADAYGYKASCAPGYTYYQWGRKSNSLGGWLDSSETCDSPNSGSCCVVDGGVVPTGAALPSEDEDEDLDDGGGAASSIQPGAFVSALALTGAALLHGFA